MHIKRIDELELKLRKKTEESRKLTISSKNAESKFNIDKRKLEMVNAKFKDKISDLTKGYVTETLTGKKWTPFILEPRPKSAKKDLML